MRLLKIIIVVVVSLYVHGSAVAESGNGLLASCEALLAGLQIRSGKVFIGDSEGLKCWHYMAAMQDASVIMSSDGRTLLHSCVPSEVTLTQLVRVFVNYARRNANILHEKAANLVIASFVEAYPCTR